MNNISPNNQHNSKLLSSLDLLPFEVNSMVSLNSQVEENMVDCANSQPCLFDHSVIAHAKVRSILCADSRDKIKENSTMLLSNHFELPQPQPTTEEIQPRKTYPQMWTSYNKAQTTEKSKFQELLYEICTHIDDLPKTNNTGRTRIPLADMIFSIVFKTYTGISGRRFTSDLTEAYKKGFISKMPHFNSLYNYFEREDMSYYLKYLIAQSASPLTVIEEDFAVDSSGFSKGTRTSWLHEKYSNPHIIDKKDWLKCHLMCGVITNIVTSVEITDGNSADSPHFEPLVKETAKQFSINEVSADKAYLSAKNLRVVADHGGMPYIPFKENSRPNHATKDELWRNMYYYFQMHKRQFMSHYHKRSNVETVFFMIKGKFGERLKNKTEKAQINELLCKILCHNICCVIQSIYELEIEAEFYAKQ